MLRSNEVLLSYAAPRSAGFVGISPKGRGMEERSEGCKGSSCHKSNHLGQYIHAVTPKITIEKAPQITSNREFISKFLSP